MNPIVREVHTVSGKSIFFKTFFGLFDRRAEECDRKQGKRGAAEGPGPGVEPGSAAESTWVARATNQAKQHLCFWSILKYASTGHCAGINIPQCNAAVMTTTTQQTMADSDQCSSGVMSNVIMLQFKFLTVAV